MTAAEASALDLLEALEDDGRAKAVWRKRVFGLYARQVAGGTAITWRDAGGRLCLVAGLYPWDDHTEAWFATGPGLKGALRSTLKAARSMLEAVAADAGVEEARAYVTRDGVAGAKLAAWFGFEAAGREETTLGPVDVFARRFP